MSAPVRPARPDKGQELELRVEDLAHGGNGVARHDGYVVFVRGGVPGDRVRAVLTTRKKDYGEAKVLEVLEPSPDRIAPKADHPGAAWQVLPYEKQLEAKQKLVASALKRLGHLDAFELRDIVPAVEQWGYRNKLEYSFGTGEDGGLVLGFHAAGSWETIVDGGSLLGSERAEQARTQVLAWARAQRLGAYDRRAQTGLLRNLVVREGRRTGEVQVRVVASPGDGDLDLQSLIDTVEADSLLWTTTTGVGETTAGGETTTIGGAEVIHEELAGLRFLISSEAFFQTNTEMAEQLYALAGEAAGLQGWERVFDLYCGTGTIGLTLATKAGEVFGLEVVEDAIRDAIANARANQVPNASFFAGDTRLALGDLVAKAGKPDVVVLDPPRAGLSAKVVRRVIETAPKRIVYVSCNPTTLAPNAAQLAEAGWKLKHVTPVDMFPQTPHIECVALLERG